MGWLDAIDGYKTYLGMIAGGVLGILYACGVVDDQTAGVIGSLIAAWTGVAIRHALAK